MFEHLMNEVECIRNGWGCGMLEALAYIRNHSEEYKGTQCLRELNEFMRLGAEMMAPVDQTSCL